MRSQFSRFLFEKITLENYSIKKSRFLYVVFCLSETLRFGIHSILVAFSIFKLICIDTPRIKPIYADKRRLSCTF
jgi:hypothetical protein